MKCNLIAVTQPRIADCNSAEDLVAYCARVSNPANQASHGTASKLLRYLVDNQHWSPFEMVHVVIEIETTRDIARQILRHRSFSFQEFSQRYAEVLDFAEPREARLQDVKNRQNSIQTDREDLSEWFWKQREVINRVEDEYIWALDNGIAKEVARSVLPEGLTTSRLYMAGTLRSWIHYCLLRSANGTQKEHREIAQACWALIAAEFPSIADLCVPDELEELVREFGKALLKKLRYTREHGRDGWNDPDWDENDIADALVNRGEDLDWIDAAAYAAFGWNKTR